MKSILIGSAMALVLSCNNERAITGSSQSQDMNAGNANKLSAAEKKDGWVSLFNGKDLSGWHKYGGTPAGTAWMVRDNSIYLDASGPGDGGDLTTNEEYGDFHLKLDWKIDTGGNSGIIFYVKEDSVKYRNSYQTGPEMQVLDNKRHSDAKIHKHRTGDLYDLIPASSEPVRGDLEWNQAEIRSVNGKLDLYLNGVNVVSTTMWDDSWKKLVAGSKFKNWAGFGTFKTGRICLQDHGNNVWFRNVRIKRM